MSYIETLRGAVCNLAYLIHTAKQKKLEPVRLARVGYTLLTCGCSFRSTFPGHSLASYLIATQQYDGGWTDVEETLWCLGYLNAFGSIYESQISKGQDWLTKVRLPCGAWGNNERDRPRIPVTTLVTVLQPEIIDTSALAWLTSEWESDLAGSMQLSYKGAFFLIATRHSRFSKADSLIQNTLDYLSLEQEKDGGYGPWKGHPLGSDPWSTGIVLWGLSILEERAPKLTIERAVSWLKSTQLPNGLWPYHYIDDGSSMALMGLSKSLPILMER